MSVPLVAFMTVDAFSSSRALTTGTKTIASKIIVQTALLVSCGLMLFVYYVIPVYSVLRLTMVHPDSMASKPVL
jgi:hypothetical protein